MFLPSNITLKFGDSGDFVSELQRRLVAVSCFSGEGINGFYDGSTVNGVSQFQSMSGIRADGIAGPETLRRLNGVISGDTSSTDTKKTEEDERAQQENLMRQQLAQQQLYEQQALLAQQQQQQAYAAQVQAQTTEQAYAAQPQPQAQHTAALPEVNYAQAPVYQTQPPQPAYQSTSAASAGDDMLARMLLGQQAAQQPLQAPQTQQPPAQTYAATPPVPMPVAAQMLTPPPALAPQAAPQMSAATAAPDATATLAPSAEAQRGMLGRAVQFMSEKMQQLSNYFESKLPNHVLNEVKAIGVAMAQSGVKEASVPTGPEPQRGVEGPQRGQQQGQQRT